MKFQRFSVLLPLLLGVALPSSAPAQAGGARLRVQAEDPLRSSPGGTAIATALPGAQVSAGETRGAWREVTLEGWISANSVRPSRNSRYPLEVRGTGTLRAAPGGAPLARAQGGMLLRELKREGAWVRVQRTGWVRGSNLAAAAAASRPRTPAPEPPPPRPAPEQPGAAPPRAPAGVMVLHTAPSGDTVAVLPADARVEVVEREGEWTRVRVEGWTRSPVRGGSAPGALDVRTVRESPDAHRGREVRWSARFIAVRRAEEIRTDLVAGEPYILARDPNGEPGFVYIAVTPQQALAAQRLLPMQKFGFVARVRTGRSALMGHPVLELVQLQP